MNLLIFFMGGITLTDKACKSSNFGRKRKINREAWQDNIRKRNKQNGLPYQDRKGKKSDGVKDPSQEKSCKRQSCDLEGCQMSYEEKLGIHYEFWPAKKPVPVFRADNYNIQQIFLYGHLNWDVPSQRIVEGPSRRQATWSYTLSLSNGRKVKVCSATFENVLQITGTRLSTIQGKIKQGQRIITDERGAHSVSPNQISEEAKNIALDHMKRFPRYLSHYSRKDQNPLQEYLEPDLTREIMYRLYKEMINEENLGKPVSKTFYKQLFADSGLKIGSPKSDVCDECTELKMKLKAVDPANAELIKEIKETIQSHQDEAALAYKELKMDSQRAANFPDENVTICVDLQQIMLSPKLNVSDNYYNSKFCSYNCGVTNTGQDKTTMFFFNSTDGQKGACEITSILFKYITSTFTPLQTGHRRVLNVFSDRCPGQNNNYLTVAVYKYIMSLGYFTQINQKFLYTGHSFLPCDRAFAFVEKASKNKLIYSPEDWVSIIKRAKILNPFDVVQMHLKDFIDFSELKQFIPKPGTLHVSLYKWISMSSDSPHLYKTKSDFKLTTEFETHLILEPFTRQRIINRSNWSNEYLNNYNYKILRNNWIQPSPQTISGLKKLLKYIPLPKQTFFNDLISRCENHET